MSTAGPQRPDRMSEDMPEDMPGRMPEDMPEHMPEDMPGRMPEDMPEHMPEDMPGRMPEDMPFQNKLRYRKDTGVYFHVGMRPSVLSSSETQPSPSPRLL